MVLSYCSTSTYDSYGDWKELQLALEMIERLPASSQRSAVWRVPKGGVTAAAGPPS